MTSLQFEDQALSLANDVTTFNQVKGMDDVLASSSVSTTQHSPDFLTRKDLVDCRQQHRGMTYTTSAQEFSSSQEFKNHYGANTTDTQYITTLYNNVLGRSPDAAGLAN